MLASCIPLFLQVKYLLYYPSSRTHYLNCTGTHPVFPVSCLVCFCVAECYKKKLTADFDQHFSSLDPLSQSQLGYFCLCCLIGSSYSVCLRQKIKRSKLETDLCVVSSNKLFKANTQVLLTEMNGP